MLGKCSEVAFTLNRPAVGYKNAMRHFQSRSVMTENFNKGGRPTVANRCHNCVMLRFDDLEFDKLIRMMELAGESVKATFIKGLVFGKTFKVHKIDKTMLDYLTKLSALFAEYRNIGVNYNIVVRELKAGFSEKKAMTLLYRLEKETKELAAVTAKVLALTEDMRNQWSQKSQ